MKLLSVRQQLVSRPLADVATEVRAQLDRLGAPPRGRVAIPVGSRGIANIATIIRTAGEWLREQGAAPFMIPAMGSHNGATAAGQRELVESLGVTEAAMSMPLVASMECVKLATVATGDVWMDRHAFEADGVLLVNRIKLHTCFSGPLQSGLVKMMVVGMGKIRSAETFHRAIIPQMPTMLREMGDAILDSGKIWAGLAILEDGLDQTAELHAIPAAELMTREPTLLERHRGYFPRLPIDDLNVLVVDEIGKNFSGTGMDTNVIGYRGVKGFEDLATPRIHVIAALGISKASHGNAIGVGLADFITRRLRDDIDEEKTFINAFTTGEMQRAKIPATFADDQSLIERVAERFGSERWMFIPNTLHLERLFVSADLGDEMQAIPRCSIDGGPHALEFHDGRLALDF